GIHKLSAILPAAWQRRVAPVGGAALGLGLAILFATSYGQHRRAWEKNAPTGLAGCEWFSLPKQQGAILRGVTENLKQTPGPVFTFHGQYSFPIWTEKPFVNGFNCTHLTALLTPAEMGDTLAKFRAAPRWSSLILHEGLLFRRGPAFDEVDTFLRNNTVAWLKIAHYELRLSAGQPPLTPRHVLWKNNGIWQLSAPADAVRRAVKWRLHTNEGVRGSGRWPKTVSGSAQLAGGYVSMPLPQDMLESVERHCAKSLSISLCDRNWKPLAAMPLAIAQWGEAPTR
ncbi:MAG: hypothetical protein ACOYMN_17225, partial [Roseimicrobium sp.]